VRVESFSSPSDIKKAEMWFFSSSEKEVSMNNRLRRRNKN
jgi:hypothetical protein